MCSSAEDESNVCSVNDTNVTFAYGIYVDSYFDQRLMIADGLQSMIYFKDVNRHGCFTSNSARCLFLHIYCNFLFHVWTRSHDINFVSPRNCQIITLFDRRN